MPNHQQNCLIIIIDKIARYFQLLKFEVVYNSGEARILEYY